MSEVSLGVSAQVYSDSCIVEISVMSSYGNVFDVGGALFFFVFSLPSKSPLPLPLPNGIDGHLSCGVPQEI